MHQRALRTVLLIQAIEETDRIGEVIPLADRAEASRWAARQSTTRLSPYQPGRPSSALPASSESFLLRRATRLLSKLTLRAPAVLHVLALAGGLTWMGRALLVVAFLTGFSLGSLDGSRRINILAFPLIGLIAW